jgi:hypothetical protein
MEVLATFEQVVSSFLATRVLAAPLASVMLNQALEWTDRVICALRLIHLQSMLKLVTCGLFLLFSQV